MESTEQHGGFCVGSAWRTCPYEVELGWGHRACSMSISSRERSHMDVAQTVPKFPEKVGVDLGLGQV